MADIAIGETYITPNATMVGSRRGDTNWYGVKLGVKLNSQSIRNNTSNITIYFYLSSVSASGGYMWLDYPSDKVGTYILRWKEGSWHNSSTYSMPTSFASTGGTGNFTTVGSWTVDVPHESDGTLDLDGVGIVYTEGTYTKEYDPDSFEKSTTNLVFPTILRNPHVLVKTGSGWQNGTLLVKTSNTVWKPAKEIYVKTEDGWQATTLRGN